MPRRVKKRRKLAENEFEEYMDYVFPADDESAAKMSKLLQLAQAWKQKQGQVQVQEEVQRKEEDVEGPREEENGEVQREEENEKVQRKEDEEEGQGKQETDKGQQEQQEGQQDTEA